MQKKEKANRTRKYTVRFTVNEYKNIELTFKPPLKEN